MNIIIIRPHFPVAYVRLTFALYASEFNSITYTHKSS